MIARGNPSVLVEDLMSIVSEYDLLAHYFNISKIPCVINSPLRRDLKPSMGLYSRDGRRIYFKDFKTGKSGGVIDLLSLMWGLNIPHTVEKILKDIPNFIECNKNILKYESTGEKKITFSKDIDIRCKVRKWKQWDIDFWKQYGISVEWLEFGNIHPISNIFIIDVLSGDTKVIPADKYAYAFYEFKDGIESIKIYQPFSELYKWRNKHDASVWDLWEQLPPYGDKLIITSSRKDALCLWENTEIPSISLQSETYLPKKHVVQQLKGRFKDIYVLYDNDFDKEINTGKCNGELMAKTFGLHYLELPIESEVKDPSDLVKKWGRKTLKKVIEILIKQKHK